MADTLVNGEASVDVPAADRGFAYGDGLFETMALRHGAVVLLDRHLERLQQGCQVLGIALDKRVLRAELQQFLAGRQQGVVKVIVTRGVGGRGYLPPEGNEPTRVLTWHDEAGYPSVWRELGIDAAVCERRLGISPMLAGLKHLNRLEQVLLRRELADSGCAEALVLDIQGRVVEGVFSNAFLWDGHRLATPMLSEAGVAGVMRAEIMSLARRLGMDVVESVLHVGDFSNSEAMFFCNSVYGIWPVARLSGVPKTARHGALDELFGAVTALFQ